MKKLLLVLPLLFSLLGNSQAITVSTSSHTVPQLVNNVLINSPCVEASNITWRTGTNYNTSNGIGYFQNTNPNFPMQSGVILSTGNAQNAPGPNTSVLNDGAASWPGDADLEATLQSAGITMSSINASVIEFDFTPISSQFNFGFIFASEEYGNFQCQFSDAFAFLLTNMNTGVTTNLAVVPGSGNPISVVTIRDFLYNSSCPSVNPQYFGTYNGGSQAAGSATNYNGQTVLLNASAALIPNTPYHIKLVIADRSDYKSDSAIFMSANSFNIGQDVLGLDLTVANHTAICPGDTHILHTDLDPSEYTFAWTKNGLPIAGQTGPNLTVTSPGTYGVTYVHNLAICDPKTDTVVIEYYPTFTTPSPITLYRCNSGAALYEYDLSVNATRVSQGVTPAPIVSYFASSVNANANVNPLENLHNSTGGQTVYVRIQNPDTGCFIVKSFALLLTAPATATPPADLLLCAKAYNVSNANYNLTSLNATILNGQSSGINGVRYFTSAANAANNVNPISNANNALVSTQTIYVRVQNNTDPNCFALTSFNIIISPLPPVDVLQDVLVCDQYILPALVNGNYFTGQNGTGTPLFAGDIITTTQVIYIYNQPGGPPNCPNQSKFKVTIINPLSISPGNGTYCGSYTLPALTYGKYRTMPGNGGTVIPPGTVITTTTTLYVFLQTVTPPVCTVDTDLIITIIPLPEVGNFPDVFDCASYVLPALTIGNYFTETNGQGTQLAPGTAITTSQTIYVFEQQTVGAQTCSDEDAFNVVISLPVPSEIVQCDPYTLPALTIGNYYTGPNGTGTVIPAGTVINNTRTIYIYIPGAHSCVNNLQFNVSISQPVVTTLPNVTVCDSYTLPAVANGNYFTGTGGTGTPLFAGDVISSTATLFIFSQLSGGCTNQSTFKVTINPLPAIDSRAAIDQCNSYTLTDLTVGNYYTGPNATGTMLHSGDVITTTQEIYIHAVSTTTPPCIVENSFTINIFVIEADSPADVVVCDSYVLPALTVGNYYQSSGGAAANATMLHAGDVITASTTLYIYTESGERINCTDENIFNITINQTPTITGISDVNACRSYTLPALPIGDFYTGPNGTGTLLSAGTAITTTQQLYAYVGTNTTPICSAEVSFTVTIIDIEADAPTAVTACDSYVLPALTIGNYYVNSGGPSANSGMLSAGSVISNSATLYIFVESPLLGGCTDENTFEITINHTPILAPVADLNACRSYTLPALAVGNYYTAANASGTMLNAGDVITTSQEIFIYAVTNSIPACPIEASFTVTIIDIEADAPTAVTACDSYVLPALTIGNYYVNSGGPSANSGMLSAGSVISNSATLYIFVESPLLAGCTDENTFEITINHTPVLAPVADLNACRSYTLPALAVGNYYTAANASGTMMNAGDVITTSQEIFIYAVTNSTPACPIEASFTVTIIDIEADSPAAVTACDSYVLPALTIGNYYVNSGGPSANSGMLSVGSVISNSATLYIFVESPLLAGCTDENTFEITINHTPVLAPVADLNACRSYTLPALAVGNYYTAANASGTMLNAGDVITTSQEIFIYAVTSSTPACPIEASFTVTIIDIEADTPVAVTACDFYVLPALTIGNYYVNSGGPSANSGMLSAGSVISNSATLFIFVESAALNGCTDENTFDITINHTPILAPVTDLNACRSYTLPALSVGNYYTAANASGTMMNAGDVITTSQEIFIYAVTNSTPACPIEASFTVTIIDIEADAPTAVTACDSYVLPALTIGNYYVNSGGPSANSGMLSAGSVISNSATLYIFVESAILNGCTDENTFEITINHTPILAPVADLNACRSYTLPALAVGNYYTAANASGSMMNAGDVITTSQEIFIYAVTNSTPACQIEASFTVTIIDIEADAPAAVTACDSYVLPALTIGNYYVNSGGPSANSGILSAGSVISNSATLYIFVESPLLAGCTDENTFEITINHTPILAPVADLNACRSYTLPALAVGNYYTAANASGTMLNAGDVITTSQEIFIYAVTNSTPACPIEASFTVTIIDIEADAPVAVTACDSYVLPALTTGNYYVNSGGPSANSGMLSAGSVISNSATLYIFVESPLLAGCTDENTFDITINHTPVLAPVADLNACRSYTLPALAVGNYYTAANASGTMMNAGDVITTSQEIFIYAVTNSTPACPIEASFTVTIIDIEADAPVAVTACDSYVLPALTIGNYYVNSGGPSANSGMLSAGSVISNSATLYIFVESAALNGCTDENTFEITINHTPVLAPVSDLNACRSYTLPALAVGNYYTAANASGTMLNAGDVITTSQEIFIYAVTNSTPSCPIEASFTVTIIDIEADAPTAVTACDSYVLPALTIGNYYVNSGGPSANSGMLSAGSVISNSSTLFIFVESAALNGCTDENTFDITINHTPILAPVADLNACRSYTLPVLPVGNYYTAANASGSMLNAGDVITTSQEIFIYAVTSSTPACPIEASFTVTIIDIEADAPTAVSACQTYTLPALTIGNYYANPGGPSQNATMMLAGDVITTSTILYIFAASTVSADCTDENIFEITINNPPVLTNTAINACESYTLPTLSFGNYFTATNGGGTRLNVGDILTTNQIVYIYGSLPAFPNCTAEGSITLTLFNVDQLADVLTCGSYVLPVLSNGRYYTGPNGTGSTLAAGAIISSSRTIYIYGRSTVAPFCYDETSLQITIISTPIAFPVPVSMLTVCDEDRTNDGVTDFNLLPLQSTILGNQTGAEFSIAFYESLANANSGTNPVTASTLATVYVRVNNANAPLCFDVKTITLKINKRPVPKPIGGVICFISETQTAISPYTIPSGLSSATHTFKWRNEAGLVVGTGANYTTQLPGVYTITATSNATGCVSDPVEVVVIGSEPPVISFTTSGQDFSNNQSITVNAQGNGDYEYMLDFGPFQTSNVFNNVASGWHTVTVKDTNGCGIATLDVLVINYPKYFTPNGDGFHDTWNITDLKDLENSMIYIFDRYGKLLKQIFPDKSGWDGTYNGHNMPSSDYWFVVNYEKDGEAKEFRAHFSLKR